MTFTTFEGKRLRLWNRRDIARELPPNDVAANGGALLRVQSTCHPTLTLNNNPEHLLVEYHDERGLLVARCHVCRAPVMVFGVA